MKTFIVRVRYQITKIYTLRTVEQNVNEGYFPYSRDMLHIGTYIWFLYYYVWPYISVYG